MLVGRNLLFLELGDFFCGEENNAQTSLACSEVIILCFELLA